MAVERSSRGMKGGATGPESVYDEWKLAMLSLGISALIVLASCVVAARLVNGSAYLPQEPVRFDQDDAVRRSKQAQVPGTPGVMKVPGTVQPPRIPDAREAARPSPGAKHGSRCVRDPEHPGRELMAGMTGEVVMQGWTEAERGRLAALTAGNACRERGQQTVHM